MGRRAGDRPGHAIASCESLMGEAVLNTRDESLGTLAHFMIDARSGRIAYAVIARGGVLGLGEKLHAIPWSAMAFDDDRRCFVVDLDVTRLDAARGFDRAHSRAIEDPAWEPSATGLFELDGALFRGEKHHPA